MAKTNRFPRALDRRLAWVAAGLLPLFIFAIVMFVVFTRQQEQAIERLLREAASGAAHLVDRAVGEQLGIMNGMAASSAFDLGDLDSLRLEAQRLSEMHPEWRTVIVTDEHRQLLNLRIPPGEPLPAPRDPESLARVWATGRATVGNLVEGQVGFRVPVVSGGRIAHTIAVPVDPRFFRAILAGDGQPRPWSAAVIGSDRGVITATPGSPLKQGQPLPADLARDASGFSPVHADYLAWAPVGESGWNVLIVAPATAVEQPFVRARTGVLVGGTCAAASTAFLVMFLSSAWAARRENAGLKSEIAERKRAENDLTIALHRLALAHEAAKSGAWEWDLQTNANVWSDELWRLYGLEPHGCVPSYDAWLQTVHPDDRARADQGVREAAEAGRELYTEWRVRAPGAPERWLMSRGRPLRDSDGNVVRYIGIVVDITHQKTAEKALHESEEKFRYFAESANEGIWALDAGQRVTFVNPRLADMLGYAVDDMIGRPAADFVCEGDITDHRFKMEERRRGERANYERRMRHRSGAAVWTLVSAVPILDSTGRFSGSFGMLTDITERKAADQSLRESEERFRLTFDTSPDAININRLDDGLYVDVNQGFTALTGWQREEVLGRTSLEIDIWHDPADRRRLIDRLNAAGVCDNLQAQFRRKDGSLLTGLMSARVISLKGVRHIVSVSRDISHRVRAEAALQESEERYRQVVDLAPNAISILVDGRFAFINPSGLALLGAADAEEIRGRLVWDFCPPGQVAAGQARYRQCEQEGRALPATEFQLVRTDGRIRTIESSALPITHKGRPAVLAVWHDLTDRRESEKRFQTIFQAIPDSVAFASFEEGRIIAVNDAFLQFTGYGREEALGRTATELGLWGHPVERNAIREILKKTESIRNFDVRVRVKDGSIRNVLFSCDLLRIKGETCMVVVTRDVTERKQSEDALKQSEANFRLLAENAPEAIFVQVKGCFAYANPAAMQLFGARSADRLIGRPLTERIHPEFKAAVVERSRILNEERQPVPSMEQVYITLDGNPVNVEVSAAPFRFQGEDGALVFVRDVSARKRAETALRENEELFRGTFDFSPVGQTMSDLDYRYLRCNDAFCRFLDCPEAGLVGRSLFEFTHPEDRSARSVIRDLLTGKSDRARFQKRYIRKDGSVVWGDVTVRLVLNPEGTPRHMLSVVQDITQKVRDAEQKEKLEAQLRQAQKMEALGTLAGGIAHDFNNILGVIIGGTEMLELTDAMRESSKDTLVNVLAAAQRAKDLVKQILAFSRHTEQEKILLNLKSIIRETVEFMRASLPSTIQLRHFIDPGAGAIVADPTQMQQVLMNLCTNAAHAMEREGGVLQIRLANATLDPSAVRFDPDLQPGSYVRLTVADTGHGIDPAVIQRIFEPYFTTKEKGKGTGLGLAVVHGILKAHNGAITVASEPGRGTTFEVFLPRAEGYETEPDTNAPQRLPNGTERILLVDDEKALVDTEQKILGLLGYQVEAATDPLEAFAAFQAAPHRFDLVLTDMTMPQMTGLKMAGRMMELRPDLPVIICTGFSDRIDQQQAQAAGIKALLMKPLMARELAEAIRGALKR